MFTTSIPKWALLGALLMVNAGAHCQFTPQDYVNLGTISYRESKYLLADKEADRALKMDRKCAEAWQLKGRIAIAQKDFSEAKQHFSRAAKFAVNKAEPLLLTGWACDSLKKPGKALKAFTRSTQADSTFHAAWLISAQFLNRQQRYAEALDWGKRATETDGLNPDAWVEYGISLMLTDSVIDGLNQLEQALRLQPDHLRAGLFKALALEAHFENTEAYAVMSRLVSQHPEDSSLHCHLWRIRRKVADKFHQNAEEEPLLPAGYNQSHEAWAQTLFRKGYTDFSVSLMPGQIDYLKQSSLGLELLGFRYFYEGHYSLAQRMHRKALNKPEPRPDLEFLKYYCRITLANAAKGRIRTYSIDNNEQTFITILIDVAF